MNRRYLRSSASVSAIILVLTMGIASGPTITSANAATSVVLNGVRATSGAVSSSPYQFTLSSFNAGTGTDRLLVVGVTANNQYATSVSFGGAPLIRAGLSFHNNDAEFWYMQNPTGTGDILVAMAGSTSAVVGAYAFSGVDQGIPIPTVVTKYDTAAASPTVALTTQYSNSWVLDLPSIWGGVTLGSPSCTQEWNVNVPGAITGASSSAVASFPGQVTCSWTASAGGDLSDDVAIELHAASTTTTTTTTSSTSTTTTTSSTTSTTTSTASTGVVLNGVLTTSGTVSASPYQSTISNFDAGTGTNRLLVVGVSANRQYVSSITFGGVPLTKEGASFHNNDAEFWYLQNPTGTANVVVGMTGSTSAVIGAYAFSGVDLGLPIPTVVTRYNTAAGSPSISITAKYSNSLVLDLPSIYGGVTLGSPIGAQQWDVNVPSAITGASSSKVSSSPGQVTLGWTASRGDSWDDVAIEIHAATTTTTTTSSMSTTTTTTSTTSTTSVVGGITVFAHRIPATYWDPCFATTCSAGSGPGVTMYFALLDSVGSLVQDGYADENGYTFSGLNPNVTYYVYPDDCTGCHGSTHDVVFKHWGDGSTVRPRAATVGSSLHAWYSCTNGCSGV